MAKVRIPTPLQTLTEGLGEVSVDGTDITTLVDSLDSKYPGIKKRILDDSGEIRRFINIYVNDEDIRFLEGLNTTINEQAEISIVPAVSGG